MTQVARFGSTDDVEGLWDLFRIAFGGAPSDREGWIARIDPERALLFEGARGSVAAASHIVPFVQWFGGRPVPKAGYSPVAVLPEYRGQGMGRAVITGQFDDLRARGEVIAGLFPASQSLYRAHGFEVAGSYVQRRLPASTLAALRPSRPIEVRRGGVEDLPAVERCHEASARVRDGWVSRDERWWRSRVPADLAGTFLYLVEDDAGAVAGYAIYGHGPGRRGYDYSVAVTEVVADDPDVVRALWRVVGSSMLQAPDVDVVGPAEDDLFLLLHDVVPTAVRTEIRWMLRLVDAVGAVDARGWPAGVAGAVHLDIEDEHAPWNRGRFVLEVEGGRARLVPGGGGHVQASIGGLSSWWAGYAPATRLARTGQLAAADRRHLQVMDGLIGAAPPVLPDFY